MVYKQKVTLQGQKLHVVPTDDIKKGAPIKKDGTKMDKSRLPKKKWIFKCNLYLLKYSQTLL